MITYCQNPVKLIRRTNVPNEVQVLIWHTGQIVRVPINILEDGGSGFEIQCHTNRIDAEQKEAAQYYQTNG